MKTDKSTVKMYETIDGKRRLLMSDHSIQASYYLERVLWAYALEPQKMRIHIRGDGYFIRLESLQAVRAIVELLEKSLKRLSGDINESN